MNTDFIVLDEPIRKRQYLKNINSKGDTRYYDDSCKTINTYAKQQNTIYDPLTNQMLYGLNSQMHVSGVSDGTCNQINPYIFEPANICGAGAAGANRCVKDAYPKAYSIENFSNLCDYCNLTEFVIMLLLIVLLIGVLYSKSSKLNL